MDEGSYLLNNIILWNNLLAHEIMLATFLKTCFGVFFCLIIGGIKAQIPDPPFGKHAIIRYGGLERADSTRKSIYLVFTGHEFNDGKKIVPKILKKAACPAHFFFTGDFYRNPANKKMIKRLKRQGHYLGPHSDKHLLYASWNNRDSLLISREGFVKDVLDNYLAMQTFGISKAEAPYFMPPYEWYNQKISDWTEALGLSLVNFTPGTRSNADYTTPDMGNRYISSKAIFQKILDYEKQSSCGLNGFILLVHIGTHPDRKDKFYLLLPKLIDELKARGYEFALLKV